MTPTRLIFGKESIVKLPEVMRPLGKRVLLTYGGGSIKKLGLYDRVKELMQGFEIFELSGIQPNPKYAPSVLEGVRICKEEQIDVILAVGGGSVLDCSKAIAAGAKYGINVFGIDASLPKHEIAEQAIDATYRFLPMLWRKKNNYKNEV